MRATKAFLAGCLALAVAIPATAGTTGNSNHGSAYLADYQGSTSTFTPNSTSLVTMGGLAGAITPSRTGIVEICAFGYVTNSVTTANEGVLTFQLSYGTGSAPAANATLTGTQIGAALQAKLATTATAAADIAMTLDNCAIVTGLTVGTVYWLDISGEAGVNTTNVWHGALAALEL